MPEYFRRDATTIMPTWGAIQFIFAGKKICEISLVFFSLLELFIYLHRPTVYYVESSHVSKLGHEKSL